MLSRASDVHGHATRLARSGIAVTTGNHRLVGYRVPTEWASLTEAQRQVGTLAAFKRGSRAGFLSGYRGFVCQEAGCRVCQGGNI